MRKWSLAAALCVLVTLGRAAPVFAQSGINGVNVLVFEPSTSPHGILTTDTSRTLGNLNWYVGVFGGYAYDPLRAIILRTQPIHSFVHHHVPADLMISMGIWKYFELGVHMPFVLFQEPKGAPDPLGMGDREIRKYAVGDLRVVPKIRFWENKSHGFGLAVIPQFTVHTGLENDNAGERFMTFEPKLALDYTFKQGTVIALNAGYRMRKRLDVIRLRIDDEVYYSVGTEINVYKRQLSVLGELFGSVGFTDAPGDPDKTIDPEEVPMEVVGGIRYRAPFGLILTAGGGAGLTDGWSTPAFRVFLGIGFSPVPKRVDKDTDGDGIVDRLDKCPKRPEDKDGFEDEDGCPDPDNDKDGICDKNEEIQKHLDWHRSLCTGKDQCPDNPEDKDGFEDTDGCPDTDNDQDGVLDASDRCRGTDADKKEDFARTKEDRDGHQDDDGCPDPDNDKDKICDNNDQIQKTLKYWVDICKGKDLCPDKPETYNGYQDEDGCPDEKPEPGVEPRPVPRPVVRPVPRPVVRPVPRPVVRPVPRPVVRPVRRPVRRPVVRPVRRPVRRPVVRPVRRPVRRPVVRPVRRPVRRPVVRPVRRPVRRPVVRPVRRPVRRPVVRPVRRPVRRPVVRPVRRPVVRPVPTPSVGDRDVITLKVFFRKDMWRIRKRFRIPLKRVARFLRRNTDIKLVEIEGHADERGTDEYNDALSQTRANFVRYFLIKQGISPKRLVAKGYGKNNPEVPGCRNLGTESEREDCWQKNRRVVFTVLKREP